MSVTTPRWQLLLLTVLIVGLGGNLWWRLQPTPASMVEQTQKDDEITSKVISGLGFGYSAIRTNLPTKDNPCETYLWRQMDILKNHTRLTPQQQQQYDRVKDPTVWLIYEKIADRYYEEIKTRKAKVIWSDPLPAPVPPDSGIKRVQIGGHDGTVKFLLGGKMYRSAFEWWGSDGSLTFSLCILP
jgi:hypothetical protein